MKKSMLSTGILFLLPALASAAETPLMVNPAVASQSGAPATGMVSRGAGEALTVRVKNSCFGTNLRGVSNPLAPDSIIHADVVIEMGGKEVPIKIKYPASVVTAQGTNTASVIPASDYTLPAGSSASLFGNVLEIRLPNDYTVSVDSEGKFSSKGNLNGLGVGVKTFAFVQQISGTGGGQYMGANGPLSVSITGLDVASDNSVVEISAAFPGQNGFCGGYFSPVMLFFSKARPKFDAVVKFPLGPTERTHWPKAISTGALLAFDRNNDGLITTKDELFGDTESLTSGFEMLKLLDTDGDGFISENDKDFARLSLWFDNGDGETQAGELVPLAKRVTKISLKYKQKVRSLGKHAEEREISEFFYLDKKGKEKKGEAADIWFAPAP